MVEQKNRPSTAAAARAEPCAVRTRAALVEALFSALRSRPLAELTVADICRRAGVHRVTFYSHWADLDALAVDGFSELIDRLAIVTSDAVEAAEDPISLSVLYRAALRAQLHELQEHRSIYRQLLTAPGQAFRLRIEFILQYRAELAIGHLTTLGAPAPGGESSYPSAVIAGGVTAAFVVWATSDDTDVEAAAQVIEAQLPAWWP